MPPYHPLASPLSPLLPPPSTKPRQLRQSNHQHHNKYCKGEGRMSLVNKKKLIPILVFLLACASVLRLLKITIVTSSSSTRLPTALPPAHHKNVPHHAQDQEPSKNHHVSYANSSNVTEKEIGFLFDLISRKSPCNLLVFGLEQEYYSLPSLNEGGVTVFLEDDPVKLDAIKKMANGTSVYKIEYPTLARDAFKLLKHARDNKNCSPSPGFLKKSRCKLALKELPSDIYKSKWDVVLVDGPCGHKPDCPGRMASIYTASLLARENSGNMTNVLVHDVDRMIEMWFSWEFLCEDNLVSSKGKFWNFSILGEANYSSTTTFCSK